MFREINKKQNISYEVEKDEHLAGLVEANIVILIILNIPILNYIGVNIIKIENPKYSRNIYMTKMKSKYLLPVIHEFIIFILKKTE